VLGALPFPTYGLTACLNLSAFLGAAVILLPNLSDARGAGPSATSVPPSSPACRTWHVAINNCPKVRQYRLSSVRACLASGSAPLPVEIAEAFARLTKGGSSGIRADGSRTGHARQPAGRTRQSRLDRHPAAVHRGAHHRLAGQAQAVRRRDRRAVRARSADHARLPERPRSHCKTSTAGLAAHRRRGAHGREGYFTIVDRRANIWYPRDPHFSRRPAFPATSRRCCTSIPKCARSSWCRSAMNRGVRNIERRRTRARRRTDPSARGASTTTWCRGQRVHARTARTYIGKVKRWQLRDKHDGPPRSYRAELKQNLSGGILANCPERAPL
jgi:hypothetical protein